MSVSWKRITCRRADFKGELLLLRCEIGGEEGTPPLLDSGSGTDAELAPSQGRQSGSPPVLGSGR